jgi:hypothetical protein
MATSPHQPKSLSDQITELKADLQEKKNLRSQIQTIGQANSGGGQSTTYVDLFKLNREIAWLEAKIAAFTDQLNGDTDNLQPGTVLTQVRADYF